MSEESADIYWRNTVDRELLFKYPFSERTTIVQILFCVSRLSVAGK